MLLVDISVNLALIFRNHYLKYGLPEIEVSMQDFESSMNTRYVKLLQLSERTVILSFFATIKNIGWPN